MKSFIWFVVAVIVLAAGYLYITGKLDPLSPGDTGTVIERWEKPNEITGKPWTYLRVKHDKTGLITVETYTDERPVPGCTVGTEWPACTG